MSGDTMENGHRQYSTGSSSGLAGAVCHPAHHPRMKKPAHASRRNGTDSDATTSSSDASRTPKNLTKIAVPVRQPSPSPVPRSHASPFTHGTPVQGAQATKIPLRSSTPPPPMRRRVPVLPSSNPHPRPPQFYLSHPTHPAQHHAAQPPFPPRISLQQQASVSSQHAMQQQQCSLPPAHHPAFSQDRVYPPSTPTLQASKALHERGLLALKEYRRLRKERLHQAWLARQQQHVPTQNNGTLQYQLQQPPFLAGRPRTTSSSSAMGPNGAQTTPSSRGRSMTPSTNRDASSRTPFASSRPRVTRRASSVCAPERYGAAHGSSVSVGSFGQAGEALGRHRSPPATPPATTDSAASLSAHSSPALQAQSSKAMPKVSPKVTPKFRQGGIRTDSQMHAETAILQPQSPPSLKVSDQSTTSTVSENGSRTKDEVVTGGAMGTATGVDEMLLQQVTALLQEKSEWTAEKQRLEKEVEQLHELVEYLFEHFNLSVDDDPVPTDGLTGLPQYIPGSESLPTSDIAGSGALSGKTSGLSGMMSGAAMAAASDAASAKLATAPSGPIAESEQNGVVAMDASFFGEGMLSTSEALHVTGTGSQAASRTTSAVLQAHPVTMDD